MTTDVTDAWWERTPLQGLSLGEILPDLWVPMIPENLDPEQLDPRFPLFPITAIVMTQGCDIDKKPSDILLCTVFTLDKFADSNPTYKKSRGEFNQIRLGRVESFHMLMEPPDPAYTDRLIVSFLQSYTLPRMYIERHAAALGERWRLKSPFLEHFSHAYGRMYARVALPTAQEIPKFQ